MGQGSSGDAAAAADTRGCEDLPEFHVVGDVLVDIIASDMMRIPGWGEDANAGAIHSFAGGSALNTAVHLAGLAKPRGCVVAFHGCVGRDSFAQMLRKRLQDACVRECLAEVAGQPTGSCLVLSGAGGRSFVTCAGATGQLSAEHLADLTAALQQSRRPFHVHFGGFYAYGPLRFELPALIRELRGEATRRGVRLTLSLDVNGQEPSHVAGLAEVLPLVDMFKGCEEEVAAVAACCSKVEGLGSLLGTGEDSGPIVVTTFGERGAFFKGRGQAGRVAAYKVGVSDTTGAGDACCAGLLYAHIAAGVGLQEALDYGSAAGAVNCGRVGGCVLPVTTEDVEALLGQRHKAEVVAEP